MPRCTAARRCPRARSYKKGELEGKPVTIMMPPPFSLRHSSYIRNYSNTGRTKVLNIRREVRAGWPDCRLCREPSALQQQQACHCMHAGMHACRHLAHTHARARARSQVVALHKDRYVLPVQLCVTKISGSGSDALFMGAMNVRCAP